MNDLIRLAGIIGLVLIVAVILVTSHAARCTVCWRNWGFYADERCRRHRVKR